MTLLGSGAAARCWMLLPLLAAVLLSACSMDDGQRVERAREYFERGESRSAAIELRNVLRNDPANVEARVLLGIVTLEAGDPESAAKELQRARELGADPEVFLVPLARALLRSDRVADVLDLDPEALSAPGDRADFAAVAGNAWLRDDDPARAEEQYALALELQSDHSEALVGTARVSLERNDIEAAEAALRRVLAKDPEFAAAHAVLGRLQLNNGRYAEAEASFRRAVEAANTPALLRDRLGYLSGLLDTLLAQGKAGRAQDVAVQMIDIAPEHPLVMFQAARADFVAGALDPALARAQQIVASYPTYEAARMLLAAIALAKENYALAETHLQTLASEHPGNVEIGKLLAQARMNLGSPDAALEALQPLLKQGASDPRILAMAGSASLRSGQRDAGIDYLTRGVEAGSTDSAVQLQAASSLLEAGEARRALEVLDRVPVEARNLGHASLRVKALLATRAVDDARELVGRIVSENSEDPQAYHIAGDFHLALTEPDAARRFYEAGLELDRDNAGLINQLTLLDLAAGQTEAARTRLEKRLQRDPGDLVALTGLAHIFERDGDNKGAIAFLEQARKRHPDVVDPPLMLTQLYLNNDEPGKAVERAQEALRIHPDHPGALTALGKAQLEAGRYSEALGALERAVRYAPVSVQARFNLARAQLKLGLTDAATASLKETVKLDPQHLGARLALTRLESIRGNYTAALATARSLKEQFPDRAEPYLLEGDIHMMRQHYNDAIEAYDKAGRIADNVIITVKRYDARRRAGRADAHEVLEGWVARQPEDLQVRVALAQAYASAGHSERAVREYEAVLEREGDNLVALNNLAWLYAQAGGAENLSRGLEWAQRAHDAAPNNGSVADTLGWLLLLQGQVDRATSVLRQALRDEPDNPDIRYHLAVALHRAGSAQEARAMLDALLADDRNFMSRDDARALRESL